MEVAYARLRPRAWAERLRQTPIAWLPVGVLEWHGAHNPYGLDILKAELLCTRAAEQAGGVVLPALWCGTGGITQGRGGSLAVRPATFRLLLEDLFAELERTGFRVCVALTGHYPSAAEPESHTRILKEAAWRFMQQHPLRIWALADNELGADVGYPGDHAARGETSLLLALAGDLVDLAELEGEGDRPVGVFGDDPRQASAAFGRQVVTALVERLARGALWALALPEGEPIPVRRDAAGIPQPQVAWR